MHINAKILQVISPKGDFKLLEVFSIYPDLLIVTIFVILALIIIVYKIDKLEKEVINLKTKVLDNTDDIKKLDKQLNKEEEKEMDIIDKYLSLSNKEKIFNNDKDPIKVEKPLKDSKISELLNPRKEGDDKLWTTLLS